MLNIRFITRMEFLHLIMHLFMYFCYICGKMGLERNVCLSVQTNLIYNFTKIGSTVQGARVEKTRLFVWWKKFKKERKYIPYEEHIPKQNIHTIRDIVED